VAGSGLANSHSKDLRLDGPGAEKDLAGKQLKYLGSSTDKIETKWRMSSMSNHDSKLFEEELSFVTLDDEDKIFADKRAAPRARPPEEKVVTVQDIENLKPTETYPLHDLSQDGLGFIVLDPDIFTKVSELLVIGFDSSQFETPMVVKIMAIREADEFGVRLKVGCAFTE
jgi:hypothetical protein